MLCPECWTRHQRPSCAVQDLCPPSPCFCHMDAGLWGHKEQTGKCSTWHVCSTSKDQQPSRIVLTSVLWKITSPIRFYGTCFAPIHSFILCWNLPLSLRMRNFSLCSRGCCHCGYHSCEPVLFQSRGQTEHYPSCWFPASFSATLLSAPPRADSASGLRPQAAELAVGNIWLPAASPPGSGHHCWHLAWLCYFLFSCSRWGALLSPWVCLPYFIPNNNKAGRQWPCTNVSSQVTQFLGLCLLLPQLLPPRMLGLSCHFQSA